MKLYKPKEVCEILNISYQTLVNWIKEGKIKVVTLPNGYRRIPEEEVKRLLQQRSKPSGRKLVGIVTMIETDFHAF